MRNRLPEFLRPTAKGVTESIIANWVGAGLGTAMALIGAWALSWLAAPTSDRDWANYFLLSLVVFSVLWLAFAFGWRHLFPPPILSPTITVNRDVATEVPNTIFNQTPVTIGILDPKAQSPLPQPKRPLTAYEVDRKMRHLDNVKYVLEQMQPLINEGMRLQSNGWNAFADSKNHPSYSKDLGTFRDKYEGLTATLLELGDEHPEYDEVVAALDVPKSDGIVSYLVSYGRLAAYLKPDTPHEVFQALVKAKSDDFGNTLMQFTRWHNNSYANIVSQIRELSK